MAVCEALLFCCNIARTNMPSQRMSLTNRGPSARIASTRFMSMASICSAISLPVKRPKPKMATSAMAHIKVGMPRVTTMFARASGYRTARLGVTFRAANQASGIVIMVPMVPRIDGGL